MSTFPHITFTTAIEIPEATPQGHDYQHNGNLDYLPLNNIFEGVSVLKNTTWTEQALEKLFYMG